MTQQSESTTTTSTSTTTRDADETASRPGFAPALPPLAEPRPPAERRVWPRTFHDRLTAPLPGLKAMARFAREGSIRPGREGLADIPRLPLEPAPLPRVDARTVAVSWAGHASWVVRIGGLTVLTDPVWSRRILGTPAAGPGRAKDGPDAPGHVRTVGGAGTRAAHAGAHGLGESRLESG